MELCANAAQDLTKFTSFSSFEREQLNKGYISYGLKNGIATIKEGILNELIARTIEDASPPAHTSIDTKLSSSNPQISEHVNSIPQLVQQVEEASNSTQIRKGGRVVYFSPDVQVYPLSTAPEAKKLGPNPEEVERSSETISVAQIFAPAAGR